MPFKYACFISYPGGKLKRPELQTFVEVFKERLDHELHNYLDIYSYLATDRINVGDKFVPKLAYALCESICMIMIFTPKYFMTDHIFCAQEYKAMELLEESRFQRLGHAPQQQEGLIMPIIYRGEEDFPAKISKQRHIFKTEFADPYLRPSMISRKKECLTALAEIAKRIYDFSKLFSTAAGIDLCDHCQDFTLPAPNEQFLKWLKKFQPNLPRSPRHKEGI